jgi:hypothetical protein
MRTQPNYEANVTAAARGMGPGYVDAWVFGRWDITAGGMVDDIWRSDLHVVPVFDLRLIPRSWKIDRSYDHGSSSPFSVGWWAESDGAVNKETEWLLDLPGRPGSVRGDLIRVGEWYGCRPGEESMGLLMSADAIARGVLDREREMGLTGRVMPGPADDQIFARDSSDPSKTVAGVMERAGLRWQKADKGKDSRVQGWQAIREMLVGAVPDEQGTRERPGLFVLDSCLDFLSQVPILPRDKEKPDDLPKNALDHIADEVRYRIRHRRSGISYSGGIENY